MPTPTHAMRATKVGAAAAGFGLPSLKRSGSVTNNAHVTTTTTAANTVEAASRYNAWRGRRLRITTHSADCRCIGA